LFTYFFPSSTDTFLNSLKSFVSSKEALRALVPAALFPLFRYASDIDSIIYFLRRDENLLEKKIEGLGQSMGGLATIEAYKMKARFDFLIQCSTPVGNLHYTSLLCWDGHKHRYKLI